uniref:PHD-type domain-containing protein n=1 Tax=Branchiostoma floridae TaxID=7739 RepID=C3YI02_BRAFL|eukprot:XP_002604128.1 hypothetical protein BRAFLDRAFT_71580 [Branchiostoma floridae]
MESCDNPFDSRGQEDVPYTGLQSGAPGSSVSKAFYVLSNTDRRQQYDSSNVIVELTKPTKQDKKTKPSNTYSIQHNTNCVTIYIPAGSYKQWVEAIESFYNTTTDYKENIRAHQLLSVPFYDTTADDPIGSVTLHVYTTTSKILVQGTACFLWAMITFEELKNQLSKRPDKVECEATICHKCERLGSEDSGVIQCNTCQEWFHYACTGLHEFLLRQLIKDEETEYVCIDCSIESGIDVPPSEEETIPKSVVCTSCTTQTAEREDQLNNNELESLQLNLDKLESILASRISQDDNKIGILSDRLSRIECKLFETKEAPTEKTARESDMEVLKKRVKSLEAENKNLRNRITALETKRVKSETNASIQTDVSQVTDPPPTDDESMDVVVVQIPTNNSFQVLTDSTPAGNGGTPSHPSETVQRNPRVNNREVQVPRRPPRDISDEFQPPRGPPRGPAAEFQPPRGPPRGPADEFQTPRGPLRGPDDEFQPPRGPPRGPANEFQPPRGPPREPADECLPPRGPPRGPADWRHPFNAQYADWRPRPMEFQRPLHPARGYNDSYPDWFPEAEFSPRPWFRPSYGEDYHRYPANPWCGNYNYAGY